MRKLAIHDRRQPFSTDALAASYVALCSDPLRDIQRWAVESEPSYKSREPRHAGRYYSPASRYRIQTTPAISARRLPPPTQRGPPIGPRPRFRGRLKALSNSSHSAPLSTDALAADYRALCCNPLSDVRRWILESGPSDTAEPKH